MHFLRNKLPLNFCKNFFVQSSNYVRPYSSESIKDKVFLNDCFKSHKFNDLIFISHQLKESILETRNKSDLKGERIAILCSNNYSYFVSLLAIWLAKGIAVPLNKSIYTNNYLEYFLNDSNTKLVINGTDNVHSTSSAVNTADFVTSRLNIPVLNIDAEQFYKGFDYPHHLNHEPRSFFDEINFSKDNHNEGLIFYTSGASGPSNGVVLTFSNLLSQIESLIECWNLNSSDCLLNVLPLNHVHGLIYSLVAPFYVGAQVDLLPRFDPEVTWQKLTDTNNNINIFTTVPAMYVKLLQFHNQNSKFKTEYSRTTLNDLFDDKMRIMGSASAPLSTDTFNNWMNLTGFRLVERYGLVETGLCLSNTADKDAKRIAGTVGRPYGEIKVRICEMKGEMPSDGSNGQVLVESDSKNDNILVDEDLKLIGELQVQGPMIFKEYNNKPNKKKKFMTDDGWFKTDDIAEFLPESKIYKIIGRSAIDLIKTGDFKISARDIEKQIISHPCIEEVAVMGIDDPHLGQQVSALIVTKNNEDSTFDSRDFARWLRLRLPLHCVPKSINIVNELPRNSMGKINKKELIKMYQ